MNSGIRFNIIFKTSDGVQHSYLFAPSENKPQVNLLTLQAPFQFGATLYFLSLTLDGIAYNGPAAGFSSINVLWQWIQGNLLSLGKWYLLEDSVLLIANATTGALSVWALEAVNGLSIEFPVLQDGEFYMVLFNEMESPEGLYTKGDVLNYVNTSWGRFGTWTVSETRLNFLPNGSSSENSLDIYAGSAGEFNEDFNNDFKI